MVMAMTKVVPLVDYLVLEPEPHLLANECTTCGARLFGRRNVCPCCTGNEFMAVAIESTGHLVTFSIVHHAAPAVPVPFVAGIVDCGGTRVATNILTTDPDPDHVAVGMKVRLATYSLGLDEEGTEAIGFGFEPVDATWESA